MGSDEHKRSARNCDCDKKEIAKHSWGAEQKKVVDRKAGSFLGRSKKAYIL